MRRLLGSGLILHFDIFPSRRRSIFSFLRSPVFAFDAIASSSPVQSRLIVKLVEHEFLIVLHQILRAPFHVHEQPVHPLDVLDLHLRGLPLLRGQACRNDNVDGVAQTRLGADARQQLHRVVCHLNVLLLAPDRQDFEYLLVRVWLCAHDHQPIEQIQRNSVRTLVLSAANLGDAAIGRDDEHGRHIRFQRAIQKREALHVQHVYLVDEQYSGYNFGTSLLPPFHYLGVNLLPHLPLDLTRVPREQCQEALLSAVDNVDLVQAHVVNYLFPLLQLALGTLHETRGGSHGVVVAAAAEGSAELGDLA
mmetsp:Transcript_37625/g.90727  ORF Transcript_37625/g.90727 Transcript_37625/m.90727 type:complete len:306 (-) Transcript_37625:761-1678(-)